MTRTTVPFPASDRTADGATATPEARRAPAEHLLPPWNVAASVRDQFRKVQATVCPPGTSPVCLALCSHDAGEGVSWVASKLACAVAEGARSVVLVDANTLHPSQKELFGVRPEEPSLAGGAGPLAWSTRSPHLSLAVPEHGAGPTAEGVHPSLALAIEWGRARADVVLVDCEPFATSAQVLHLRGAVDGVLLVVESERKRREVIGRMLESLRRAQVPVVGVVISKRRRYIPSFIYRLL